MPNIYPIRARPPAADEPWRPFADRLSDILYDRLHGMLTERAIDALALEAFTAMLCAYEAGVEDGESADNASTG